MNTLTRSQDSLLVALATLKASDYLVQEFRGVWRRGVSSTPVTCGCEGHGLPDQSKICCYETLWINNKDKHFYEWETCSCGVFTQGARSAASTRNVYRMAPHPNLNTASWNESTSQHNFTGVLPKHQVLTSMLTVKGQKQWTLRERVT